MDFRLYDPAIARFNGIDPVTHHSFGTSVAFDNNPIFWADPSGADSESFEQYWNRQVAIDESNPSGPDTWIKNRKTGEEVFINDGYEFGHITLSDGQFKAVLENAVSKGPESAFSPLWSNVDWKTYWQWVLVASIENTYKNTKKALSIVAQELIVQGVAYLAFRGVGRTLPKAVFTNAAKANSGAKLLPQGMVPNAGGKIVSFTTEESSIYYRVYSSNPNGGAFLTKTRPKSRAFAREGLALPEQYNTATHIQQVTVPAGVTLQRSRALPAFGKRGGLEQFQILNRDSRIIFNPGILFN